MNMENGWTGRSAAFFPMTSDWWRTLCVLLLAATAAQGQPAPTVNEIVARHVEALGGSQNLDSVHTLIKHLVYREGDFVIPDAFVALGRPYYKTLADPRNLNVDVNEGFDGSSWEYYRDPGVVVRTVGAAAAASRHGTEIFGSLVDYKVMGTKVELSGLEQFGGRPSYRLHVTLSDGFERDLFVDRETFLIIGERKAAPIHAYGEAVRSESRIGDYRRVGGVMFPFSTREVEIATGRELSSDTIQSIEINPKLDAGFFSPPQFTRTPLQQFLEQLYAERTDPVSVMWTYRRFRAAHPTIDTRAGVEFIGYQMAKMGDFNGSVELLTANTADYPKSASAQYSLGRAYQGAGDKEDARKAFDRALAIDPGYKRAHDGLNALK
jgi:hypothetical protein